MRKMSINDFTYSARCGTIIKITLRKGMGNENSRLQAGYDGSLRAYMPNGSCFRFPFYQCLRIEFSYGIRFLRVPFFI